MNRSALNSTQLQKLHLLLRCLPDKRHRLSAVLTIAVAAGSVRGQSVCRDKGPLAVDGKSLKGRLITADALHTQRGRARWLVEQKQAD